MATTDWTRVLIPKWTIWDPKSGSEMGPKRVENGVFEDLPWVPTHGCRFLETP